MNSVGRWTGLRKKEWLTGGFHAYFVDLGQFHTSGIELFVRLLQLSNQLRCPSMLPFGCIIDKVFSLPDCRSSDLLGESRIRSQQLWDRLMLSRSKFRSFGSDSLGERECHGDVKFGLASLLLYIWLYICARDLSVILVQARTMLSKARN